MIYIGTSGYSYKDWIGPFYPEKTKTAEMLSYYAQYFSAVEINATYYSIFSPKAFESMAQRTPSDFRFSIKAPGTVTHLPTDTRMKLHGDVRLFEKNIEPIREAEKLAALLLQFPSSFKPAERTTEYLRRLRDAWPDLPLVAEFRNRAWQTDETLRLLAELRMGFCNVDQPQFKTMLKPSADVSDGIGYVRFHGRNYQQWWKGDNTTRYDYLYTPTELEPWTERIAQVEEEVKETLSFFNNHRRAQAVENAEMLGAMLKTRFGKAADDVIARIQTKAPKKRRASRNVETGEIDVPQKIET